MEQGLGCGAKNYNKSNEKICDRPLPAYQLECIKVCRQYYWQ